MCVRRFVAVPIILSSLVLSSTATELSNRVSVVRSSVRGQPFKVQLGADGTIHLLLDSDQGPLYAKYQDRGLTFSEPVGVVDAATQKPGLKFSAADLVVGKDGRVFVAMSNNAWKLKLPQEEWSFYLASLAPGRKTFSPVRNLNRKSSEGFGLAADKNGAVTATFLSGKLFAMFSRDNGETFTSSAELDPSWNPCDCCTTSAVYGQDGKLALLYREETDNERDMFLVLWDQRSDAKPKRTRVSGAPWKVAACPMTYFTVNSAPRGYVAAWPTKGQVYFTWLDKAGEVLPPGEIKTPGASGMRNNLVALSVSDGVTLIGWKNKDVLGWQLYEPTGRPIGNAGSTESPGSGAAGVVLNDGRFLLFP